MSATSTISASGARTDWSRWLLLAGRLILGGVFIYAAYSKLDQHWSLFAMTINSYQMVSESTASFLAHTLPWFELVLGAVLLTGWALRWSAAAAAALLLLFFSVMLRAYLKNLAIFCGCFGIGEKLGPRTLARDGSLAVLALAVMIGALLMRRRRT
jgi:putative oxidoreductase